MYINIDNTLYRVLIAGYTGSWVIEMTDPFHIRFFAESTMKAAEKIPEPEDIYMNRKKIENGFLTKAQKDKYEMIGELLNDEKCIFERKQLKSKCAKIAAEYNTTASRVERTYRKYLATSSVWNKSTPRKKKRNQDDISNYAWAIQTLYFSSKRMSLRDTYDLMLLDRYTENGKLREDAPSFWAFRRYFYEKKYSENIGKTITRNGKINFLKNERILYGNATDWRDKIGSFQMDATIADIYLVSRFNRKDVVGRPNVYLAVDTATQLIAGFYVGFNSGFSAVSACLYNAMENKEEYCHRYGLEIEAWQWPNADMPGEIITDSGSEFMGEMMNEMCKHYGVACHAMPPFRPDRKGIVEMSFDLIQKRYKGLLRGKGVIEEDAQERWATDYRKQAVLTLDEFTKIMIRCIVYLNSGRTLQNKQPTPEMAKSKVPMIPARLWMWHIIQKNTNLIKADKEEFFMFSLNRTRKTVQRKGIFVNGLWYSQMNMDKKGYKIGTYVTVAYDSNDLSKIWVDKGNNQYEEIPLMGAMETYKGLSKQEHMLQQKKQAEIQAEQMEMSRALRLQMMSDIQNIVKKAEKDAHELKSWDYGLPQLRKDHSVQECDNHTKNMGLFKDKEDEI